MTSVVRPSREIDGEGRTVRELLAGRKYSIDYCQRGYTWQLKQVAELLDAELRKADLDARHMLYQRLAERIWTSESMDQEAAS
jgi:hypothetical protein